MAQLPNFTINPQVFASMKIGSKNEDQQFLYKLSSYLTQLQAALSTIQQQVNSVISANTSALGTISGANSYNVNGAQTTSLTFTFTTATTLTLNNLPIGASVFLSVRNNAGTAQTFTLAAATPDGVSYSSIQANLYNAQHNLGTGFSIPATTVYFFIGISMTGPALNFVGQ